MNEFDLIKRYFNPSTQPAVADLGIGDDAALFTPRAGFQQAISVDMLVSGRHFFADADPWRLGYKALAVNLSDIAAMGGIPRWFTLALALPHADPAWLAAFSQGLFALASEHSIELVGGDTTRGPLTISIQIAGDVEAGTALTRSGARAGDDVWVSGVLGAAAAAVASRAEGLSLPAAAQARCRDRLELPTPRVALGRSLRNLASACLDVSDGLLGDLAHICGRSGLQAELLVNSMPIDPVLASLPLPLQRKFALRGGDEYELCFCAPVACRDQLLQISAQSGLPLTRVGRMLAPQAGGKAVQLVDEAGTVLDFGHGGFDHFGN